MSLWGKKDTARETHSSDRDTSRAFHDARNDAASSGSLDERNESKVSDSEDGPVLFQILKSIFGGRKD